MVLTVAAAAAVKTPIFLGKRPIPVQRASGFTLIDVMAWGSLGHALGFAALAVGSFSLL